jgi:phage shock protein A
MLLSRLANLFRGFMSLFVSGVERRNPEALLEVERENLRGQIAQYNQGLAAHAGLAERLIAQVRRLESDEQELRARTTANLRAGNKQLAGELALRLQTVSRELEENRKQAQQADETYKNLLKARDVAVKAARDKIEKLRFSLDDLKVKKAMAEMTEMATGMVNQIGGAGDTLDRLHSMVEEEREKAAGRVRVARDSFDTSDIQMKEAEQNALAEQALADFAAKEGIAMPGATASPQAEGAVKSMGPVTQ